LKFALLTGTTDASDAAAVAQASATVAAAGLRDGEDPSPWPAPSLESFDYSSRLCGPARSLRLPRPDKCKMLSRSELPNASCRASWFDLFDLFVSFRIWEKAEDW
jgi:hypothetical protein